MLVDAQNAYKSNDFQRAIDLASKIPITHKEFPNARYLRALAGVHVWDTETTLRELEVLTKNFPKAANAHGLYSSILFENDQSKEAELSARRAVELAPRNPDLLKNLGLILDHNGWQAEARIVLSNALSFGGRLDRKAFVALLRNSVLAGDAQSTRPAAKKAMQEFPNDAEITNQVAHFEFGEGHVDLGESLLERAKMISPRSPDVLSSLGYLRMSAGETKQASEYLRTSLKENPYHGPSHFFLAHMGGSSPSGDEGDDRQSRLHNINQALPSPKISYLHKVNLGFAKGKLLESLKKYDQAFEAYDRANKMVWARMPPGAADVEQMFDRVKSVFNEEYFARNAVKDSSFGSRMIFIIGMPRSGTTLLEQTLTGCPNVDAGGENGDIDRFSQFIVQRFGNGAEFPEAMAHLSSSQNDLAAKDFMAQFDKSVAPGRVRTNKDMRLFLQIGLIATLFPGAKLVHSRRNPLDTCLSAYFQFFKMYRIQYSYDLVTLGKYYRAYARIMEHWKKLLPGRILDLSYEDMVSDQETQAQRVVDFCYLEWHDDCLNFHKSKNSVKTASIWQVRQKVYQTSKERWRRYEKHLAPLIESLGDLVSVDGESP